MSRVSKMIREGRSRALNVAVAGVLAVGMMPLPAFAADLQAAELQTQASMSADGYVIGAAFAAAEPAPDILGLNNPEERSEAKATDMKLAIFGTDINEAPDPYFANTYTYLNTGENATPRIITDARSMSPMSARQAYHNDGSESDQVWDLLPEIVLGTGSDLVPDSGESGFYDTAEFARAVETANGLEANSYHPIAVTYDRRNLNTMITVMYKMAQAADKVVADSNGTKKLRYGSAMDIARDYELYVTGTKSYVLQKIQDGTVPLRTVANVQSYDATAGVYKIIDDGAAEGTATQNRLLESVQGVTTNYYTLSSATPETVVGDRGATTTTKTVTADELKDNVDLIIYGGQASDTTAIEALNNDGLLAKTFYAENMSSGSIFGVTVNSVENAQNVGRVLPCVYPEILDQSDMVAYYYDHFYHLKTSAIAPTIAQYMDGVRNWDATDSTAYLMWDEDDVADYNEAEVEAIISEGVGYANLVVDKASADVALPAVLEPTENLSDETPDVATAVIEAVDSQVYTGKAIEPALTVKVGGFELVAGTDYDVTYANNVNVGKATATVKGKGAYEGTATVEFDIVQTSFDRLAGKTALDTMSAIVDEGQFEKGGTVVLSTAEGYWDALTAAGIAGMAKAPVLMTYPGSLSDQTKAQLTKLAPKTIIVCGGTEAMPDAVVNQAKAAAGNAEIIRCAGKTATGTAVDIYKKATANKLGEWSDTAFICTNQGYWDALSAAPISYAKAMPIFLTENDSTISDETLKAMKDGGIKQVYIVGGEVAITKDVADAITKAGFEVKDRLAGKDAVQTSEAVAEFALLQGMSADKMGVATNSGYWDALSAAPFLGKNNSVLVLVDGESSHSITGFVASHKSQIKEAYVFGGEVVVTPATVKALETV